MSRTAEELAQIGKNQTDIDTYRVEMFAKFTSGKLNPNDDNIWTNYVNTIRKMGLDERLKIEQVAFNRFRLRLK